jgi:molybdenum cofactor biosynthesis enzyme MoaA
MRHSLYWDDFERRIQETAFCVLHNQPIPIRRVSVFITESCNFNCAYCNVRQSPKQLSQDSFNSIVATFHKSALLHITGGEPSTIPWLYDYMNAHKEDCRFHLNTNAYKMPPVSAVKRLKVSLDSCNADYFNAIVGRDAFDTVVSNIKRSIPETVTSVTYTLTKDNYQQVPEFIMWANKEFPNVYALFFSTYKGTNPRFVFSEPDIEQLFTKVIPIMEQTLPEESLALFKETLDEKLRLIDGKRFPENSKGVCYLAQSEAVFTPDGERQYCSHLYRDNVTQSSSGKTSKCMYGCNRRLVAFNEEVEKRISQDRNNMV